MAFTKYLLAGLIFSISCTAQTDNPLFDKSEIKSEVSKIFEAYVDQTNSTGLEGIEAYFSDDERFYWVEDGRIQYPTKEAMVAEINEYFPTVDSLHLEILDQKIDVLDEDTATLFAEYTQDIALKSGFEFTLDGAMTILLIKKNGQWRFLNGHSSVKKPRNET